MGVLQIFICLVHSKHKKPAD